MNAMPTIPSPTTTIFLRSDSFAGFISSFPPSLSGCRLAFMPGAEAPHAAILLSSLATRVTPSGPPSVIPLPELWLLGLDRGKAKAQLARNYET